MTLGTSAAVVEPPGREARRTPLSLRHNFSWTLVGNVVYAGCQWGMLVGLAKLGTPEMLGQFALAFAVTAPVFMLTNLNLRAVQATDARLDYSFGEYFALRLVTTAAAMLAVAAIAGWGGYRLETALVILAVGAAKMIEAISDILYGLFQQHERMDRIAVSMMIKGPLSLAALAVALQFTGSVLWGSVALATSWAAVLAAYDLPNGARILRRDGGDRLRPKWGERRLVALGRLAFPLGCVTMLIALNSNIPRYFIERDLGEGPLGIFAAVASLMVAGTVVINALAQSASPRLSRYRATGDAAAYRSLIVRLYGMSALIGVAGVTVALTAGQKILMLLYGPEYALHSDLLTWLMASSALSYVFGIQGTSLTALRRFRIQAWLHALSAGISLPLFFYFTRSHGLLGASYALLIQTLIMMVAYGWAEARARASSPIGLAGRSGELPAA